MSVITLTTDFGLKDHFVGVMKGVILTINPSAQLIDLAHDLPPQGLTRAAFVLLSSYSYFPIGTVHLGVVDPGVGGHRAIVAIQAENQLFVGPDNGLFSYVLDRVSSYEARYVTNPALRLSRVSRTFHGRDLMAPAAAHLSLGFAFEDVGPPAAGLVRLSPLQPEIKRDFIKGRVIYVDRFGNLITNIPNEECEDRNLVITAGSVTIKGLAESYSSAESGQYLALAGSSGFLEIARSMDCAEEPPELTSGTPVLIKRSTR